jgi:hypothetical protein
MPPKDRDTLAVPDLFCAGVGKSEAEPVAAAASRHIHADANAKLIKYKSYRNQFTSTQPLFAEILAPIDTTAPLPPPLRCPQPSRLQAIPTCASHNKPASQHKLRKFRTICASGQDDFAENTDYSEKH